MHGARLPAVLLLQLLAVTVAAQSITPADSTNICVFTRYTGDKSAPINKKKCGEKDEIYVNGPLNIEGSNSTEAASGNKCNANMRLMSNNLVLTGSITVKHAHKCGPMFNKVRHIKSYDNFAIRFANVTLDPNSFASLRRIELVNVLNCCHLTKSDIFLDVLIPTDLKRKFQELVDVALKPCRIRNLIPTTTETPVYSSERDVEHSMILFKLTVDNAGVAVSYLFKRFFTWPPFIIVFVWYFLKVVVRQQRERTHMSNRGTFRTYMGVIKELLPQAPLAVEMTIKLARFFDKSAVFYYVLTDTILQNLEQTSDDAVWCEAKALRKQLKEVGVPVMLEIDSRNKKWATQRLITAPLILYSEPELRKMKVPQVKSCVIEMENELPKPRIWKWWNVPSWFKSRWHPHPAHHFSAMEKHPIAKQMAERFLGDGVLQVANADLAQKLTMELDRALRMQQKLEEVTHNTLNLYRMMEDKARDDEYEYAYIQRTRNRKFMLLEYVEDVMLKLKAEGKKLEPTVVEVPPPLEEYRFKFYSESMTLSENIIFIDKSLLICETRSEENFIRFWRRQEQEILQQPIEHPFFISLTATARIRRIIVDARKINEQKEKKALVAAKEKKYMTDAEWTKAKKAVVDDLKRTGQLKGAFASTTNLRNPEYITFVPLKPPVPFVEVQEAVHIVQTERRIRKTGVSESDLPPKPAKIPAPAIKRGLFGFLFKKKSKPQDIEAQPVDENKKTDEEKKTGDPKTPADPKTTGDQKKPEAPKAVGDVKKTGAKQAVEGAKTDEKKAQAAEPKPKETKPDVVKPTTETPKPEAPKPDTKAESKAPEGKKTEEKQANGTKTTQEGRRRTVSGPASLWPALETTRPAYYRALPVLDGIRRERRMPEREVEPYNNWADRGIRERKQKKKKASDEQ